MPALNFFRFFPKQKDNLVNYLEKRGLKHIETKSIEYQGGSVNLSLYFSSSPKKSYVKWIKHLQQVFKIPDKQIDNYSAVIVISAKDLLYAVSYGIAHFYISRFADSDFGVNIAARILSSYRMKNSRSFGGRTTKTISTYDNIPELVFEGGESVSYIRGKPVDVSKWGKTVSCGQSVQVRKRDFTPANAHQIALILENTLKNEPIRTEIPRSLKVVDKAMLTRLTQALVKDMASGNYMFSISEQQLSGVEFLFSDMYSYHIRLGDSVIELEPSLSLEEANDIARKYFGSDYLSFLDAEVEAREDGERVFSRKLITFIDYVNTEYNYYLDEGIWYQFDRNYIRYLENAVGMIPADFNPEIVHFDEPGYRQWLKDGHRDAKEFYRERYLNLLLAEKHGYENYDRDVLQYEKLSVEYADLVREDEFVFVKIGTPQKLNYVIDQSMNVLRILQHNGFRVTLGSKKRQVNGMTLWIFLSRKTPISSLNELHSLTFLMKLANWRREVLLAGCRLLVKVSYFE